MKANATIKRKKTRNKQPSRNYYSVKWEPQSFKVRVITWLESIWTSVRYFPGKLRPTVMQNEVASELSWMAHTNFPKRKRKQNTNWTYNKCD